MNILFLADPNSIHDIKWITFFSRRYQCYLIARRHHLATWDSDIRDQFFDRYGIRILGSIGDFSIKRFPQTIGDHKRLKGILTSYQIDIFHIMYAEPNSLWRALGYGGTPTRWVLTTRGTDILKTIQEHFSRKDLLNRIVSWLYRRSIMRFDQITCTSGQQLAKVKEIAGRCPVEIIRTGVNVEEIMRKKAEMLPGILRDREFVLCPRNMRPLYNHEFTLRAIRLLPDDIKKRFTFVFVDRDSADKDYVRGIEEMMLKDTASRFVFLDRQRQESIWEMYKRADLVVMNPVSDGAPVSAMEAMLCETPLILGNLPYDEDIFGNRVVILSAWDEQELAAKMKNLLSDNFQPDLVHAAETIREKANRNNEMEKLDLIYRALSHLT